MSQRNSSIEIPQPTSLRRSPRLLQLKLSPQTPNLISENTYSRKPQKKSEICAKSSEKSKEFDNGSSNCSNSVNGYVDCAKSGNGSMRKSNFGSGICKEVVTLADVHMVNENNDLVDLSVFCNTRSRRKSKVVSLVEIDSLAPVTPIDVGEKKCRGFVDSGTSGSIVLSLGDSERRVTRSCLRKMGENVKDIGLFDGCVGGVEFRRCVGRVRGAIGDRRSLVCGLEKVDCGNLVCGLEKVRCRDLVSPLSCERLGGSFEGRITRSVSKRVAKGSDLCGGDRERGKDVVLSSNVRAKRGSRKAKEKKQECIGKGDFRRNERRRKVQHGSIMTVEVEKVVKRDIGVKEKEVLECGKKVDDKLMNVNSDVSQGGKLIGVKRKRKEGGRQGRDIGWSNEQEAALQRAYFAAKPSPHFWKKVAKMVPGKTAQECFDKVHSANITPLSPRYSSWLRKHNSPSELPLTGDALLKTTPKKTKTRRKSHVARKNVRHLLQKYCQDNEADLFSVLEPSGNPLAETLKIKAAQLTPIPVSEQMSSPGLKKNPLSRFSSASKSPLTSPPVLKKVKNMALHEKYIDQLHVRDGKRKVVSLRCAKLAQHRKDESQNSAQRKVAIKAAKDALVSDARDVIEKFQQSRTNLMEVYSDSEDVLHSDSDEDDTLLL